MGQVLAGALIVSLMAGLAGCESSRDGDLASQAAPLAAEPDTSERKDVEEVLQPPPPNGPADPEPLCSPAVPTC